MLHVTAGSIEQPFGTKVSKEQICFTLEFIVEKKICKEEDLMGQIIYAQASSFGVPGLFSLQNQIEALFCR